MPERALTIITASDGQPYANLGTLSCKVPSAATANAYAVLELRLQPGQGSGLHYHMYEEELVCVLSGACMVGNADTTWELSPGGIAVFPKQVPHFFRNISDTECVLMITAIPGGLDRYFTALDAAIAAGDRSAIIVVNEQYGIVQVGAK
jgi:quercetin dioxygenase-like cupin family protein